MRLSHSKSSALAALAGLLAGCSDPAPPPAPAPTGPEIAIGSYAPSPVGRAIAGKPWITHLRIVDLDADGLLDALFCEGLENQVVWLRQTAPGAFEEIILAADLSGPAHIEAFDLDGDGDLDPIVACMGVIFPNNDPIGSLVAFVNLGQGRFTKRVLLDRIPRANDVQAADLDGDGDLDLALAQFGYYQGQVSWLRQTAPWEYESFLLSDLPGAINVCLADFDGDGSTDIAALISQDIEEIHLFANDGSGVFKSSRLYGSTNQDFGSSGIAIADLNQDGRPDLLYTNGDGFDLARPGPRPWHGVQWLENLGGGTFAHRRLGNFPGAYSPLARDFDGDGDLDVMAVSGFADWKAPNAASLILYRNDGAQQFSPVILARSPTHLLGFDAADLDGDGQIELLTGGFHAYPPYDDMSRLTLWKPTAR